MDFGQALQAMFRSAVRAEIATLSKDELDEMRGALA